MAFARPGRITTIGPNAGRILTSVNPYARQYAHSTHRKNGPMSIVVLILMLAVGGVTIWALSRRRQ